MIPAAPHRVSLVLPISTVRAGAAAMQVVVYLLRDVRVELDVLRGPAVDQASGGVSAPAPWTILFVSGISDASDGRPVSGPGFEARLRARIQRGYARQGISNVQYELYLL
jgi:hypothetical protein